MDLPELTSASNTIRQQYDARRFKWRFKDGKATFEAFYDGDSLEKDERGHYAPQFVSFVPSTRENNQYWAHVYKVRMNRATGMLFADPRLDRRDYYTLRQILGIDGLTGGPAWNPSNFLQHLQQGAKDATANWNAHKIQTMGDLPESYRRNVEESNKIYWCGWKQNGQKHQTDANYQKTLRWLGKTIADECRTSNISTCWTDDPTKAKAFPTNVYELQTQPS